MVVVPVATPETTPDELIVAIAVLPLLHAPPPVELVKEVGKPTHALVLPVIAPGNGLTVTVTAAEHPVLKA